MGVPHLPLLLEVVDLEEVGEDLQEGVVDSEEVGEDLEEVAREVEAELGSEEEVVAAAVGGGGEGEEGDLEGGVPW